MSNPQDPQDLPEGVIDNEPAGGWESGRRRPTQETMRIAVRAAFRRTPPTGRMPRPTRRAAGEPSGPEAPSAPAGPIEGDEAGQGADPDLAGDADLEQGRGEDPSLDPGARERQEGL